MTRLTTVFNIPSMTLHVGPLGPFTTPALPSDTNSITLTIQQAAGWTHTGEKVADLTFNYAANGTNFVFLQANVMNNVDIPAKFGLPAEQFGYTISLPQNDIGLTTRKVQLIVNVVEQQDIAGGQIKELFQQ